MKPSFTSSVEVTYYCSPVDDAGTYTCVPMPASGAPRQTKPGAFGGARLASSEQGAIGNVPSGDYELRTEQGLPVLYRTGTHLPSTAPRKTYETEVMYENESEYASMRTIRQ